MLMRRNVLIPLFAAFLLAVGFAPTSQAADATATGTWKWSTPGRNGGDARETTLKLKQDGDKLTGTISMGANGREAEITDGKVKDGEVSFKVVRKGRNNNEITSNYSGKIDGDVLKGKIETNFNGTPRTREFEAKRAKDKD
jgi:hypothetical protein